MRRYENRSTMMTSNRPLEDRGKLIGDVPSATAILDRFLHHAEMITITGRSYRLRNKQADKAGGRAGPTGGDEGTKKAAGAGKAPKPDGNPAKDGDRDDHTSKKPEN
jgi:hypothetical protein